MASKWAKSILLVAGAPDYLKEFIAAARRPDGSNHFDPNRLTELAPDDTGSALLNAQRYSRPTPPPNILDLGDASVAHYQFTSPSGPAAAALRRAAPKFPQLRFLLYSLFQSSSTTLVEHYHGTGQDVYEDYLGAYSPALILTDPQGTPMYRVNHDGVQDLRGCPTRDDAYRVGLSEQIAQSPYLSVVTMGPDLMCGRPVPLTETERVQHMLAGRHLDGWMKFAHLGDLQCLYWLPDALREALVTASPDLHPEALATALCYSGAPSHAQEARDVAHRLITAGVPAATAAEIALTTWDTAIGIGDLEVMLRAVTLDVAGT